jgi:hypothetical protein
MSVRIEATGHTIEEALGGFRVNLDYIPTEELLAELRDRYAKDLQVVKIVPFYEPKRRAKKSA